MGIEKRDITPKVGIYNRSWGAAASDVATGIHKPLFTSAMAFSAMDDSDSDILLLVTIDLGWLQLPQTKRLMQTVSEAVKDEVQPDHRHVDDL